MDKEQAEEEYKIREALREAEKISQMHDLLDKAKKSRGSNVGINLILSVCWLALFAYIATYWNHEKGAHEWVIFGGILFSMMSMTNSESADNRRRLDALTRLVEEYALQKPNK